MPRRAAEPADGADRETIGGLELGPGRRSLEVTPGPGAGRGGHYRCGTGGHQPVFESRAVDVLPRAGAIGGFQREAAATGRRHQGRARLGLVYAGRGGMKLSDKSICFYQRSDPLNHGSVV